MSGPWIVLCWAVPRLGRQLAGLANGSTHSLFEPVGVLSPIEDEAFSTIPLFAFVIVGVTTIAIARHRQLLRDQVADNAATHVPRRVRYGAIVTAVVAALFTVNAMGKLLAGNHPAVAAALGWSIEAVAIYFVGRFTLVLPAIAVDRSMSLEGSRETVALLGSGFGFGLIMCWTPYFAAISILAMVNNRLPGSGYSMEQFVVSALLVTLNLAQAFSITTYLSRAYLASTRSGQAPDAPMER